MYYLDQSAGICVPIPKYKIRYDDLDEHKTIFSSEDLIVHYDRMADNYKDKLPLIFGKWDMLKNTMQRSRSGSLVQIINCQYNKIDRESFNMAPAIIGGIKEYYENVQSLARHHGNKLEGIYNDLKESLEDNQEEYEDNDSLKNLLFGKLKEIRDEFMFTDVDRFMHNLQVRLRENPADIKSIVKRLESIYANEVSFFLYLVVGREFGWDIKRRWYQIC